MRTIETSPTLLPYTMRPVRNTSHVFFWEIAPPLPPAATAEIFGNITGLAEWDARELYALYKREKIKDSTSCWQSNLGFTSAVLHYWIRLKDRGIQFAPNPAAENADLPVSFVIETQDAFQKRCCYRNARDDLYNTLRTSIMKDSDLEAPAWKLATMIDRLGTYSHDLPQLTQISVMANTALRNLDKSSLHAFVQHGKSVPYERRAEVKMVCGRVLIFFGILAMMAAIPAGVSGIGAVPGVLFGIAGAALCATGTALFVSGSKSGMKGKMLLFEEKLGPAVAAAEAARLPASEFSR